MSLFGLSYAEYQRRVDVWCKARPLVGANPSVRRQDDFGWIIDWADYGDTDSAFGWEIDHIHPKALGGADELYNLRPLHCSNNRSLGGMLGNRLGSSPTSAETYYSDSLVDSLLRRRTGLDGALSDSPYSEFGILGALLAKRR